MTQVNSGVIRPLGTTHPSTVFCWSTGARPTCHRIDSIKTSVPSLSSHTNRCLHRPLPKTIWSTKNVTMRPTIITHTCGSIRQAIVSREETEQLNLSSGGLNDLKTTKTRFALAGSKKTFSITGRLSLPLCNRRTWDKVCPLQERNSQSPVFFCFFFKLWRTKNRMRPSPYRKKKSGPKKVHFTLFAHTRPDFLFFWRKSFWGKFLQLFFAFLQSCFRKKPKKKIHSHTPHFSISDD